MVFQQKLLEKDNLLKNSKYTLSANLINQISSLMIFLVVPNILSTDDYAKTVFLSVLMSFMVLSDFGMSFVYSRKMPSVYHDNNLEKIEAYNQTFFWFRLIMSISGSIVIGLIYFFKYHEFINSLILFFLNPLSLLITFFISQHSVREDFKVYKDINIKNSFAKLFIVPFSYLFGLSGWIFGQLLASSLVIKSLKGTVLLSREKFDFKLIKNNTFEALILLANFFFWNQLLNSGRLFASTSYEHTVIVQYGLVNAGYSLLLGLITSIFLPVTIASLKIMHKDPKGAIKQIFKTVIKTSAIIAIVVIIAIEVAPYLYEIFFPKYEVNLQILEYQLLSLVFIPIIATFGNIFLGMKKPIILVLIYGVSFVVGYSVFLLIDLDIISASFAQFVGMNFLGVLLLTSVFYFFYEHIENKLMKFIQIFSITTFPYLLYFSLRSFI